MGNTLAMFNCKKLKGGKGEENCGKFNISCSVWHEILEGKKLNIFLT